MAEYVPPPTELLQLITDDRVATLLNNIPLMAQILPYAGSVLAVIRTFRPVETHKAAVIQWFRKLSEQLERNDRNLENIIRIEALNLRYGEHIVSIKTAIKSSANIARARDDAERQRYVQLFNDVCSGQRHTLAMDNLIEGLRGTGTLQTNIMDHYYEYTCGDPSRVRSFTKELLQLVYGGFMAMCMYETLMHDQRLAEEVLNEYTDRMKEVQENIQVVFDRCNNILRENLMRDLNEILDSNDSNSDAVNSLSRLVSEKYDWLQNYCIVCNEAYTMDRCFEGNYVSSYGRKGRFGVIFYQDDTRAAIDQGGHDVASLFESFSGAYWLNTDAKDLCRQFIETFRDNGFETCGCAVIKPKTSLVYRSLYTIFPGFLNYANTIAFKETGTSSTAVHFSRHSYTSGPKVIYCVVMWKQTNPAILFTDGFVFV